ncbi:MAG: hemerythrin domain-containing protein [Planctomycetota bacterium]|nr:MAG: hemerythrin domain-containing protein [Planctomycetota bacterium]REK44675.1 MAG: hemerythrin domain-containing protein [Planctomycetota bacterium]
MHGNQLHHDPQGMQHEHQLLRKVVQEIGTALAERPSRDSLVADLLEDLCGHMLAHFDHEESDGHFSEIVQKAPWLTDRVDNLRVEHDRFRERLDAMSRFAQEGDGSEAWRCEMEDQFCEFTRVFLIHEEAENRLFQEAFSQDIGTGD